MSQKIKRLLIVFAGIVAAQAILYGPSLLGRKILLPLDALALPGSYLPNTFPITMQGAQNEQMSDPLLLCEPARHFAARQLKAGHFPMWATYHYAGVPFIWPKFSPFLALGFCTESPKILPWCQMLAALVAGTGAYMFFRRVLRVAYWPAVICAWCYPITSFFVLWQGFPTGLSVYWLPWLLLAIYKTVRRPTSLAPVGLAVATTLVLVSGHLDMAGQVLLASGLFALWCLARRFWGKWFEAKAGRAVLGLTAGWLLGFLLAAPYILPVLDHSRTGARMVRRAAGLEERPPVGWRTLPQIVLPDIYGTTARFDWGRMDTPEARLVQGNQLESAAAGYAGLLATLLVAPLAFQSIRHRAVNWFWLCLGFFGMSWSLNMPGLVQLMRLPGLNMLSHNRWVFLVSFSILALSATGLDQLVRGRIRWRAWCWSLVVLLGAIAIVCGFRSMSPPEPLDSVLGQLVLNGGHYGWVANLEALHELQQNFAGFCATAAVLSGLAISGWICLRLRPSRQRQLIMPLGVLLVGDLLWSGYGRNLQSDPELYFPPVPALQEAAKARPTRIVGFGCLFASLCEMCGLHDVRGYDSVDPAKFTELVLAGFDSRTPAWEYARILSASPRVILTPEGTVRLSPILDMLGVQYVIFRGEPLTNARPVFRSTDYWILENTAALPHVFVPRRVETITNDTVRMEKLADPGFDPRDVAYVETSVGLAGPAQGEAEIVEELPTRITVSIRMATPGLVVLSDRWDTGWRAYLNKTPVPILRTNHAVRGVAVPAGVSHLEFRYEPQSFALGVKLAAFAAAVLVGWTGFFLWRGRSRC